MKLFSTLVLTICSISLSMSAAVEKRSWFNAMVKSFQKPVKVPSVRRFEMPPYASQGGLAAQRSSARWGGAIVSGGRKTRAFFQNSAAEAEKLASYFRGKAQSNSIRKGDQDYYLYLAKSYESKAAANRKYAANPGLYHSTDIRGPRNFD